MTDPTVVIVPPPPPPPPPPHDADFSSGLAIPPLDDAFFSQQCMEGNGSGDDQEGDLFHEDVDFDFSFDDLCLPSSDLDELLSDPIYNTTNLEYGDLLDEVNAGSNLDQYHGVFKSDCPNLRHLPVGSDKSLNGSGVLDSDSPGLESNQISGYFDVPSPESNGSNQGNSGSSGAEAKGTYCSSPESRGSGNCGSNVSKNSENCARSVNSVPNANTSLISYDNVDQKIKFKGPPNDNVNSSMLKRKKETDDLAVCDVDNNLGSMSNKFRKSECNVESLETDHNSYSISCSNEDDGKKKARLMRNRESAQLSRQRKKQYVEELEDKVRAMHSTIQDLNAKISFFMTENVTLRQQMGAGGSNGTVPPPQMATPHPGMFPHPAMMYPWMASAPPYMMRPHGSQVPLVPIPRLKSQQPASVAKASKKVETKKSGGPKIKKVAAVSFLGLLFFIILFGNLVPMISMKYGGVREAFSGDESYVGGGYHETYHGRLLMANGTVHVQNYGGGRESSCISGGAHCSQRGHESGGKPGTDESVHLGNGSEPLVASLYVPRNDKLVKIDGNLIIHSVLASEKAMVSQGQGGGESGLAVRGDLAPAVPVPGMGRNGARVPHLRALGSGSAEEDSLKSKANDGRLQQWFREGLSGPMLSSGMCTEVFQFDVSSASTSGAIVPAAASRNISVQQNKNSTRLNRGKNRRILHGHAIPLPGSSHNISEEQAGRHSQNKNLNLNNSASSVVVSVLMDPREASDTDVDGVMGAKAVSRIFVVVLIDSVKYVTYSCMLPFKGAGPHLVTT
ncbi:bZIP transcription factor 17-like [Henckelia pumila]|uniref:bZIP transcription factor 17-like n=1 Tax=Henckelia pumila TaxID=405737 RepID=UPI003C6E5568